MIWPLFINQQKCVWSVTDLFNGVKSGKSAGMTLNTVQNAAGVLGSKIRSNVPFSNPSVKVSTAIALH